MSLGSPVDGIMPEHYEAVPMSERHKERPTGRRGGPTPLTGSLEGLPGGGEMGKRIRTMDWSATPLGPTDTWSPSLRSVLSICLGSRFPIAIYWGPEFSLLYNDAWSSIPGDKHPWALGRPAREAWSEIWDIIGPMFE